MGVTIDFGPVVSWLFRLDTDFKRDLARMLRQVDYVLTQSIDRDELPERVAAERRILAEIPDLVDELRTVGGLTYDQACARLERELRYPRATIDAWMRHRERRRRREMREARDREIVRLVKSERWPYERVGRRVKLSAARVGQIVAAAADRRPRGGG